MKTAIIYMREKKNEMFDDGFKGVQEYNCKQCAEYHNLQVIATYCDIRTENHSYPQLKQMNEDCIKLKPDAIILYSITTLGRDLQKTWEWIYSLKLQGIKVIFCDLDTSPHKNMFYLLFDYFCTHNGGAKE